MNWPVVSVLVLVSLAVVSVAVARQEWVRWVQVSACWARAAVTGAPEDTALKSMVLARAEPILAQVRALAYGVARAAAPRAAVVARRPPARAEVKRRLAEPQAVKNKPA